MRLNVFVAGFLAGITVTPRALSSSPERQNTAAETIVGGAGAVADDFDRDIAPLLKKYCVSCHGGENPEADVALDLDGVEQVESKFLRDREFWATVGDALRNRIMPPGRRPKPDDGERGRIIAWIERGLAAADGDGPRDPGRVTARRLNKLEYRNTVRDLLHLPDYEPSVDFPADDRAYGFDNNGDVLTLSPILVELYLKATEDALKLAFKDRESKAALTRPAKGFREDFANRQAKVRLMIKAFAPRAYRRLVSDEEVDRLMEFAALSFTHDGESFDRATMLPMRAAMMSPEFLFRIEQERDSEGAPGIAPLDEFELASRLSYFLWCSMPDDELFQLAAQGKLRDSLEAQVRRMLQDPRAAALTESFAGQWLEIRGLDNVQRDPERFPGFTPALRAAMKRETELFFETIVKEDASILDLLTADFTFVNGILAEHYGIVGVEGDEFRRVRLDAQRRGGILTHASILTVTSKPTRTSPVNRGKWILDNLFNTPPPPPPPDVPSIEDDGKKLTGTLREIMAKHRADANCISCHARMDPLGFALENYDAIGRWRSKDGEDPVDASGTLVTGESFRNPAEFRAILASKRDNFRRGLAEKLTTYALGRGLESYDRRAVEGICAATNAGGDRFSALMLAIVRSNPFQYRRAKGATNP